LASVLFSTHWPESGVHAQQHKTNLISDNFELLRFVP
jgi:hypothetical protein